MLHDHRMSDYIAGEVQDYIGTEMEFYDLVPVGTEMSSLVPEKLVNCGYLDITEDDFPEMKLASGACRPSAGIRLPHCGR